MTKTLSIRNFKLELNIIKDKNFSENLKREKRVKDIEAELMYRTIVKEKHETLAKMHWLN